MLSHNFVFVVPVTKQGINPQLKPVVDSDVSKDVTTIPNIDGLDFGRYVRKNVSNVEGRGRKFFDVGLRLMLSYQHEMAARCFLACLELSPHCALAHAFLALCHSPNYNFKGEAYYESAHHPDELDTQDLLCVFPSQQVADRHSEMAINKMEEIRKIHKKGKGSKKRKTKSQAQSDQSQLPTLLSDVEVRLVKAIRKLTCQPGVEHSLSIDLVGRPYADAMRSIYEKYPEDPEVAYCFAESLMVLNAWQLYEFPTGKAVSPDVDETRNILEAALQDHPDHAGLCHMYVHLSEMSSCPEKALSACIPLRNIFPHAGHLIHMPTHIDVLVGDYETCVKYNVKAIEADEVSMRLSPVTSGVQSFYFGYIVHNYHMAVYGAILGGFESVSMNLAKKLNRILTEKIFEEYPDLTAYLESYSALDVHVLVRFGRWKEILDLKPPKKKNLMLFRTASIKYAQALAYAALGKTQEARREVQLLDSLRGDPEAEYRILHNNSIGRLLAVDSRMAMGEIAYREGSYETAFAHLRTATEMQDNLNYDEPWGKMQPVRHALGGLLLEQGLLKEAEEVFRKDLDYHPKNPWALVGLINVLKKKYDGCCSTSEEISKLEEQLKKQRQLELADYEIKVSCVCCRIDEK